MSENAKWLGYVIAITAGAVIVCVTLMVTLTLSSDSQRRDCRAIAKTEAEYVHCMHPSDETRPR